MSDATTAAPAQVKPAKKAAPKKPASTDQKNWREMIIEALTALKKEKRGGSSRQAIMSWIAAKFSKTNPAQCKMTLKRMVAKGELVHTKGVGASGSFKLGKIEKPAKKPAKKPAAKKVAKKSPKKAAAKTKKPAAAKKSPKKAPAKKAAPAAKKAAAKSPAKKAAKPAASKKPKTPKSPAKKPAAKKAPAKKPAAKKPAKKAAPKKA